MMSIELPQEAVDPAFLVGKEIKINGQNFLVDKLVIGRLTPGTFVVECLTEEEERGSVTGKKSCGKVHSFQRT